MFLVLVSLSMFFFVFVLVFCVSFVCFFSNPKSKLGNCFFFIMVVLKTKSFVPTNALQQQIIKKRTLFELNTNRFNTTMAGKKKKLCTRHNQINPFSTCSTNSRSIICSSIDRIIIIDSSYRNPCSKQCIDAEKTSVWIKAAPFTADSCEIS